MEQGFYSEDELSKLGLGSYGKNVLISKRCSLYGRSNIHIGNNVRIDDFCVLSAGEGIYIGNYVHIATHSLLMGSKVIKLKDFSGISSRVAVYSSSDDYSGHFMTNPTVSNSFTNVQSENVIIGRHAIIGSGSTILPGVHVGDGAAVLAMSLVTKNCDDFHAYFGIPAKKIKKRSNDLLKLEKEFLASI
ncbi:acyltransferase [Francisella hispaniensis]|uniref:acyltransferase n=1 Tax=Francisella hispaniensis TaxID=622488 RepID=UPI0019042139|nr:acyltransferase [Francisella hispaniensis]MBK2356963.1 acyltransferase [Francisella hispaniensis]